MKAVYLQVVVIAGIFAGCSEQEFAAGTKMVRKPLPCKEKNQKDCDITPPSPPPPPPVQLHEAVFAVRNLSCALCHAKVESNVISDFAATAGAQSAAQSLAGLNYVTSHSINTMIKGKFFVPSGEIDAYKVATSAGLIDCSAKGLGAASNAFEKVSLIDSLKKCAEPKIQWSADSEKFITKSKIEINPVSSPDEVRAIAVAEAATLKNNGAAPIGAAKIDGISGSSATGFKAAAAVNCEGAIVFDGPVLLKDTTISTQNGCRIYSTASILVFGQFKVKGSDDTANVQLLSPLFIGFDIPTSVASTRLKHIYTNQQAFSRGTAQQVSDLIAADYKTLGVVSEVGSGSASYKRLAVSAPVVYSRSSGQFSGVIIAEQFLGKIGALSFVFDPVFKQMKAPLFSEIKSALVTIED